MSNKDSKSSTQAVLSTDTTNIVPVAGDIIIPVMGLTGSGKSSFINSIPGKQLLKVGYGLESCTVSVDAVEVDTSKFPDLPWLQGHRLILVDTPGFDDTHTEGYEIMKQIGEWLGNSHRERVIVGGLIYLHDISLDRYTGTARKALIVFRQLCGKNVLNQVVIGTTKSDRVPADTLKNNESRLKEVHWKEMIDQGAQVFRLDLGNSSQAKQVVNAVLQRFKPGEASVLKIQHELVDLNKPIDKTHAWTAARSFFAAWTESLLKAKRLRKHLVIA